jgi:hypothetical protein
MLLVSARKWVCLQFSITDTRTTYLLQWQGTHNIHPLSRSQTLSALCPELTGGCDHRSAQETYRTLVFQSRSSEGRQLQSRWELSVYWILMEVWTSYLLSSSGVWFPLYGHGLLISFFFFLFILIFDLELLVQWLVCVCVYVCIPYFIHIYRSQDSAVSITTGYGLVDWGARVRVPEG